MYIGVYPSDSKSEKRDDKTSGLGDPSKVNRMRHACWIDLINLLMWVVTASWVLLRWLKGRRAASDSMVDAEKGDEGSI